MDKNDAWILLVTGEFARNPKQARESILDSIIFIFPFLLDREETRFVSCRVASDSALVCHFSVDPLILAIESGTRVRFPL